MKVDAPPYLGPLRGEPLPIELHNTLYAVRGAPVDGLADEAGLRAWLEAMARELPVAASAIDVRRRDDFVAVRGSVREALHAALEARPVPGAEVAALNRVSAASPQSIALVERGGDRHVEVIRHGRDATDTALATIAAQTIELVAGPRAEALRACGASGCVLLFLKDHPRREWCSTACGNRARQARHYKRTRDQP